MRKPNIPQLRILMAAHRNGGRLPSQSFAYYGVYAPYGGTEKIQAALAEAAGTRNDTAAEQILLDRLDRLQMLMAGGFLDVERRDTDARGTLAERYVAAIRAGRIESGVKADNLTVQYVRPSSLYACIRAGWLDEKWRITEAGYAAGRAVEPSEFRPLYALNWREDCYRRAVQINASSPHMGAAADELIAEAYDEAVAEDEERVGGAAGALMDVLEVAGAQWSHLNRRLLAGAPTGAGNGGTHEPNFPDDHEPGQFVTGQAGRGKTQYFTPEQIMEMARTTHAAILDRASRVAAGMGGYNASTLTAEMRQAEKRGIAPSLFRRLLPAVTGDLVDELFPRIVVIRDEMVRLLIEAGRQDTARTVAGDPRETGYRVALVDIRQAELTELIRKTAFLLEICLSACRAGSRDTAERTLARAAEHLAKS